MVLRRVLQREPDQDAPQPGVGRCATACRRSAARTTSGRGRRARGARVRSGSRPRPRAGPIARRGGERGAEVRRAGRRVRRAPCTSKTGILVVGKLRDEAERPVDEQPSRRLEARRGRRRAVSAQNWRIGSSMRKWPARRGRHERLRDQLVEAVRARDPCAMTSAARPRPRRGELREAQQQGLLVVGRGARSSRRRAIASLRGGRRASPSAAAPAPGPQLVEVLVEHVGERRRDRPGGAGRRRARCRAACSATRSHSRRGEASADRAAPERRRALLQERRPRRRRSSESSGRSTSASSSSASRLVARMRTVGPASISASHATAAASMTCSQLSTTSNTGAGPRSFGDRVDRLAVRAMRPLGYRPRRRRRRVGSSAALRSTKYAGARVLSRPPAGAPPPRGGSCPCRRSRAR